MWVINSRREQKCWQDGTAILLVAGPLPPCDNYIEYEHENVEYIP